MVVKAEGIYTMQNAVVRVKHDTHELLRTISEKTGETMQNVLEKAVAEHYKALFWAETNAAFAALRADEGAWDEALKEREAWDETLSDGLAEWNDG
ncbi:toxin-antitoxin system protein [Candidatus Poribacteria bacterium]